MATIAVLEADCIPSGEPKRGKLNPQGQDNNELSSNLIFKDFIVSARFYNPVVRENNNWSHGFYFRNDLGENGLLVDVRSDGMYFFRIYPFNPSNIFTKGELPTHLNLLNDQYNDLKLVVQAQRAYLLVNESLITTVDLPEGIDSGRISIGTAFWSEDKVNGSVDYENLSICALD